MNHIQSSKIFFGLLNLMVLFVSVFLILNQTTQAQQIVCPENLIEQITNDPDDVSERPSISADGNHIAFDSTANFNGGNQDGNNEIYIFNTLTGMFTQITDETSGISIDASVNANGTRVAFESTENINGGNPDQGTEVFLFDTITGVFTQITDGPDVFVFSADASINADGTRIAFRSDLDITGGNPEGNPEIYLFDTTTATYMQVTNEIMGFSIEPSINADGTRIAFESTANINGGNPEENTELYLYDSTAGIITQITFGTVGSSGDASINADGTRVAFRSNLNINGGNPDNSDEIYIFDTTTGTFTQVTNETGFNGDPSINADGTLVTFQSSSNINGGNPGVIIQIYLFDSTTGIITQITNETSIGSLFPSIDANGSRIAFESAENINGGNPDGFSQIYLAHCFDPTKTRNIPTLNFVGIVTLSGILGIISLFAIRRRKSVYRYI